VKDRRMGRREGEGEGDGEEPQGSERRKGEDEE
jgi:hypothetical protein